MSHTYALLPVSRSTYDEIRGKLQQAGYSVSDPELDMHGIALVIDEEVAEPYPSTLRVTKKGGK